jgi:hypothetical protein
MVAKVPLGSVKGPLETGVEELGVQKLSAPASPTQYKVAASEVCKRRKDAPANSKPSANFRMRDSSA